MTQIEMDAPTIEQVSQLYKALSDPTRLKIVVALAKGEANVSELVRLLEMEQSAVSHQLKLLRLQHLVKTRKLGKSVYYSLDDHHVLDILAQTLSHISHTHPE